MQYGNRDYKSGEALLSLRSACGLTQAGLAERLGVSRRAVGEWEVGNSYPKAENLKQVIVLAIKQEVFPAGHEMEEIRALWKATRQKILLEERWVVSLLLGETLPRRESCEWDEEAWMEKSVRR